MFLWLLIVQWIVAVGIAAFYSPLTWIGQHWTIHEHLIGALVLGGMFASYPIYCILRMPGTEMTRHVVAIGQMLQSALLVHVTGGRIESHFHVFGSLAFLAFYRDWRVLVTASSVVLIDHIALGIWFPRSVYGVAEATLWRSVEHGFWVVFEVVFLVASCRTSIRQLRTIAERQAESEKVAEDLRETNSNLERISSQLETANDVLESKVTERTRSLSLEIVERRQAEERLSRQSRLLKTILDSLAEGVAVADKHGNITMLNSAAEQFSTAGNAEQIREKWAEEIGFFLPDQVTPFPTAELPLMRACRGEQASEVEIYFRIPGRDDGLFIICDGHPLRDDDGELIGGVVIFRDFTARRRLEEKLRESYKIEAVGRLAGGIAHDFNNLMTVVVGYAELLLRKLDPQDPSRHLIGDIKKSGEQAAALTRQLLAFSRKQVVAPVMLDLNEEVRGLEQMMRRLVGDEVEVTLSLAPGVQNVEADPAQLEQVLVNLVINSNDAMQSGGKLTVSTESFELDENEARRHPDTKPGPYVLLKVADTGCGMSPNTLAHLFEPFFTTKGLGKGTGLGLATVYGIVKQFNGYISVDSRLSQGTTISIGLPAIKEKSARKISSDRSSSAAHGPVRILLVEDEPAVRSLTKIVLQRDGYAVIEAADAEGALQAVEKTQEPIHLLLTDLSLPKMNGRELADQLVQVVPGIKMLFMTGHDTAGNEDTAICQDGCVIQKPFTPDRLSRSVRDLLSKTD
jgi:PAS domain S-box-containing protein